MSSSTVFMYDSAQFLNLTRYSLAGPSSVKVNGCALRRRALLPWPNQWNQFKPESRTRARQPQYFSNTCPSLNFAPANKPSPAPGSSMHEGKTTQLVLFLSSFRSCACSVRGLKTSDRKWNKAIWAHWCPIQDFDVESYFHCSILF